MSRTVAIIPARGGSQGIPDKNILDFEGRPLISWAIQAGLQAKGIDRVLVSTDSERIAAVARTYGAEVPFLRPVSLANADTAMEPVLNHAYQWLIANENYRTETMVLLVPTNPLRETRHVEDSLRLFQESGADSVMTVNESPAHYTPYWTVVRRSDGAVMYYGGKNLRYGHTRRQDFPERCFAKNDLVYVFKPENLLAEPSNVYGERVELLLTSRIYDCDINTLEDWQLTSLVFRHLATLRKQGRQDSQPLSPSGR